MTKLPANSPSRATAGVLVTQPILAKYRLPLFARVSDMLGDLGLDFLVVHPPVTKVRATRRDQAHATWVEIVRERELRVLGRKLYYRQLNGYALNRIVITELAASNLNALVWAILGRPYILWGHGKNYTPFQSSLADKIEAFLLKRSLGALVYMPAGRDFLIEQYGVPEDKVVAFMNTTDTRALSAAISDVTDEGMHEYFAEHGLDVGAKYLLYVGGLDHDKRVGFLAESISIAVKMRPDLRFVVAGRGGEEETIANLATSFRNVYYVGYADTIQLALLGENALALICPGKIGLLAVDALALGKPVLSTFGTFHAPEAEYLTRGISLLESEDSPESFAIAMIGIYDHPPEAFDAKPPTVEESAKRIVDAIRKFSGCADPASTPGE